MDLPRRQRGGSTIGQTGPRTRKEKFNDACESSFLNAQQRAACLLANLTNGGPCGAGTGVRGSAFTDGYGLTRRAGHSEHCRGGKASDYEHLKTLAGCHPLTEERANSSTSCAHAAYAEMVSALFRYCIVDTRRATLLRRDEYGTLFGMRQLTAASVSDLPDHRPHQIASARSEEST